MIEKWISIASHTTEYEDPIALSKGEIVTLGELAPEENWKEWIWAENSKQQGGWVPLQLLEKHDNGTQAKVLEDYSAKELNISPNELVQKHKSLNGWSWISKLENNEQGWVPNEVLEQVTA